jgi:superfamily II DNA or RNA helicase
VCFVGLSATPFTRGLGKYFSNLVVGATATELIENGYLVPSRVFAPTDPDLSTVKTVAGDYQQTQLGEAMNKPTLVADIVSTWQRLGENRQTLAFATNIVHSKTIAAEFQAAGIEAVHIDAYTDSQERQQAIARFKAGEIKILTSVGVLTTGFDAPRVQCLIFARPTKSLALHIQQWGRGIRVDQGKTDCLVLDHAGNTQRLGFVTDPLPDRLDMGEKKPRKQERKEPVPSVCPSCSYVKPAKTHVCPACGFAPERQNDVHIVDGELTEIKPSKTKYNHEQKQAFYSQLLYIQQQNNYKHGWVSHTYKERIGVWPSGLQEIAEEPDSATLKFVIHKNIKYSKGKKKKAQRACTCGSRDIHVSAGSGPHFKRADCNSCGRTWWLGKGAA